jgi:dimethylamine/trimethylamine dehydrogenase
MEQQRVQSMLMKQGIPIRLDRRLQGARHNEAELSCVHTGEVERIPVGSVVLVTSRAPDDWLYRALMDRSHEFADHGVIAVRRVGDCLAPGTIAAAVFSGHEFARNLDDPSNAEVPFRRERVSLM